MRKYERIIDREDLPEIRKNMPDCTEGKAVKQAITALQTIATVSGHLPPYIKARALEFSEGMQIWYDIAMHDE